MRNEKKNERLVVVDDDSIICELLTAYFRPRGYEVETFADAESALMQAKISYKMGYSHFGPSPT